MSFVLSLLLLFPFIGISDAYTQSELAWNAGARWQRILFYWDAIQPNWNGEWQPNRFVDDAIIGNELARGFELVGIIGNPPRWATGEGSVPQNLDLPVDDPNNNWARFTRRLAQTYAGRVDTWVIWNEPDIPGGRAGSTWSGSEADYWKLLKTAYKAIKEGNPKARVAFAGTTYWADAGAGGTLFLERVLEQGEKDPEARANGFFFDVLPFHIYSSPYKVYEVAQLYRNTLRRHGLDKPIWLAETNVPPYDDRESRVPRANARASLEEQASFMIQTVALARAAGVERVEIYKMMDGVIEGGEPWGLVRNDKSIRPSYTALQTAVRYLLGPGKTTYRNADGVARVTIENGRERTTVVWATEPLKTPAQLPPFGTKARVVDKRGEVRELAFPTDSPYYDLTLAPATANSAGNARDYFIGGDPLIVLEEGVGDVVDTPTGPFFPLTGFNVTGPFLDYFQHRGGVETFGLPISRPFRFLGKTVQMFQRQVMELRPNGSVGTMNVLDAELLPYTRFNGAVVPPTQPGAHAIPNEWDGDQVHFKSVYDNTVPFEVAFPDGRGDRRLVPGFDLEIWGLPTSEPMRDPANADFVYQRFQRGVMHYDRKTGETHGMLLAGYLRAILTGEELPADLESEARSSRLFLQYRRGQLPDSDLTGAFEREAPGRPTGF